MTAFPTCKNCTLEKLPCARREAVKAGIAGLGITSVKILCSARTPVYVPGQRVTVTWPVPDGDDEYGAATLESWPATIIGEVRSRFLIKVDDVRSDNDTPASGFMKNKSLYAKVPALKLKPLDEPFQLVCRPCGRVGLGRLGTSGCQASGSSWVPQGCVAKDLPRDPRWATERHANGRRMWTDYGMLLDDQGNRSIFDDVDQ